MKLPDWMNKERADLNLNFPLWPATILVDDIDKVIISYAEEGGHVMSEFPPSHHVD